MGEIKKIVVGRRTVNVVLHKEKNAYVSNNDKEMDKRATVAVRTAIDKAKVCKKPIAKYDTLLKKAYVEYSDGARKYVE